MTSHHPHVVAAWNRTIRLAERGDAAAIARMTQLVNAVLDVRESFARGDRDAGSFAREIVTLQTESIIS